MERWEAVQNVASRLDGIKGFILSLVVSISNDEDTARTHEELGR